MFFLKSQQNTAYVTSLINFYQFRHYGLEIKFGYYIPVRIWRVGVQHYQAEFEIIQIVLNCPKFLRIVNDVRGLSLHHGLLQFKY